MQEEYGNVDFSLEPDFFIEETTGLPLYTAETRWKLLDGRPNLWSIPTKEELLGTNEIMPGLLEATRKHYYSAAAVTLRFIQQLPVPTRLHLRELIIKEDQPSVAWTYRHPRGLISVCQENPQLRVEHRVDLWRTYLVTKGSERHGYGPMRHLADWIRGAKELQSAGMPSESYTLVLHGPTPEASQKLADVVMKAAIWQDLQTALGKDLEACTCCQKANSGFSDLIWDVLRETIPVMFEAVHMAEPWNTEDMEGLLVGV